MKQIIAALKKQGEHGRHSSHPSVVSLKFGLAAFTKTSLFMLFCSLGRFPLAMVSYGFDYTHPLNASSYTLFLLLKYDMGKEVHDLFRRVFSLLYTLV